ncbi:MAG: hypothetical protein ACOCVH_00950 [Verrucomicrobiota bacterium]
MNHEWTRMEEGKDEDRDKDRDEDWGGTRIGTWIFGGSGGEGERKEF